MRKDLCKTRMRAMFLAIATLLLSACAVGPNYVRPPVEVTTKYKEAPKGWKIAEPRDDCNRGMWWKIFKDSQLDILEAELNAANQSIAVAEANFRQALALVGEARATFFPTLAAEADLTRQKQSGGSTSFISTSGGSFSTGTASTGVASSTSGTLTTFHTLALNGSWGPDLWGSVRRNVEASVAGAQSMYAAAAVARLAAQASLAQFYFQLRALDTDQKILNDTVVQYKEALKLTQNRYVSGVVAKVDVVQAESQLETAQALAINNGIARAQTEHAIAVLLGQPPATLFIPAEPLHAKPPSIPLQVPSVLLERRPDIAQAERLMAQANAQIGVAIAAYFPALTLTATGSYTHKGLSHWLSIPGASWSIAAQLAETIIDGGLRDATVKAARAVYDANVASYRQTVLTAFQNVEDSLASLRILEKQTIVQNKAAASATRAVKLILNEYKAGTVDYTTVITAQNAAYTAQKTAADVVGQEMTAAVGLIKALGGGWDGCPMCCVGT